MIQRYDANGFPQPDVPGYDALNQDFGREANYAMRGPKSAVADLEALAAANNTSTDRTPASGKYVYNSATGEYIWVPATAAAQAPVAGLSALQAQERRGGRGEPAEPGYEAPSTQTFAEGLASAGIDYGNAFGGFLPGGWLTNLLGQKYKDYRLAKAAEEGGHTGTWTGYAAFGDRPNNTMTEAQTQAAIAGTGGGPLSGAAFGGDFSGGDRNYGGNSGGYGGSYGSGSVGGFSGGAGDGGGGDSSGGSDGGRSARDGSGFGGTGSGIANGGRIRMAKGGIGDLGGYSDGGRLLRGPGDGVSDSIPANIGGKRPARLADGEFVVPARIVSELGNGSTEAGARKLYAMLDRIQAGRKKSIGKGKVATNSRADKNLPA